MVNQNILFAAVPVISAIISLITSYFVIHRYEVTRDKIKIKDNLIETVVKAWAEWDNMLQNFVNMKKEDINLTTSKTFFQLNSIKAKVRLYSKKTTTIRAVDTILFQLHDKQKNLILELASNSLDSLKAMEIGMAGSIFIELLDRISSIKINYKI